MLRDKNSWQPDTAKDPGAKGGWHRDIEMLRISDVYALPVRSLPQADIYVVKKKKKKIETPDYFTTSKYYYFVKSQDRGGILKPTK